MEHGLIEVYKLEGAFAQYPRETTASKCGQKVQTSTTRGTKFFAGEANVCDRRSDILFGNITFMSVSLHLAFQSQATESRQRFADMPDAIMRRPLYYRFSLQFQCCLLWSREGAPGSSFLSVVCCYASHLARAKAPSERCARGRRIVGPPVRQLSLSCHRSPCTRPRTSRSRRARSRFG
jgi:hypothetical protein